MSHFFDLSLLTVLQIELVLLFKSSIVDAKEFKASFEALSKKLDSRVEILLLRELI